MCNGEVILLLILMCNVVIMCINISNVKKYY